MSKLKNITFSGASAAPGLDERSVDRVESVNCQLSKKHKEGSEGVLICNGESRDGDEFSFQMKTFATHLPKKKGGKAAKEKGTKMEATVPVHVEWYEENPDSYPEDAAHDIVAGFLMSHDSSLNMDHVDSVEAGSAQDVRRKD